MADKENGSIERVNQATERALSIFNEAFKDSNEEIFVLIYEYLGENSFNAPNDYLQQQFPIEKFKQFYNQIETVDANLLFNEDDDLDKLEIRIIIGKLIISEIKVKNILKGIANTEMGFDPGINQTIFFIDPVTNNGFKMYDDRGCFVWSNQAENIISPYINLNKWVSEFNTTDIREFLTNDSNVLDLIGGARIGMFNATFPFATLNVKKDKLVLRILLRKFTFHPSDIVSIEPYTLIPLFGQGIRIHHNVSKYNEKIIFWTFKNPKSVVQRINQIGFSSNNEEDTDLENYKIYQKRSDDGTSIQEVIAILVFAILILSLFFH